VGNPQAWGLALNGSNQAVYSDSTPRLTRFDFAGQTWQDAPNAPPAAVQTTPLLTSDGRIYSVAPSGLLEVPASDLSIDWSWPMPAPVEASMNIDCARDSSGAKLIGRPGVLYVAGDNGKLYAVVVESRGLDVSAAWPRHQHDPRNTGNSALPLS